MIVYSEYLYSETPEKVFQIIITTKIDRIPPSIIVLLAPIIFLAVEIISPTVSSAAEITLASGVFVTWIFLEDASAKSILSVPTPLRPIILSYLLALLPYFPIALI